MYMYMYMPILQFYKISVYSLLYDRANSSVLRRRLKTGSDDEDCTKEDKLFHIRAAATGKARSPIVDRSVLGTSNAVVDADRNLCRDSTSATLCSTAMRYDGAEPCRQRKTRTASLNTIRSGTRSQ